MDKRVYRRAVCRYHSDKHGRIQTAHCEGDEVENLFDAAAACIAETDAEEKARVSRATAARWRAGVLLWAQASAPQAIGAPGRPSRPLLVSPRDLPRRGFHSADKQTTLIHAVAHIEFNAINLAWDAVYRFRDLPRDYYDDWVRVADKKAHHYTLLRERLRGLGYAYGGGPARGGRGGGAGGAARGGGGRGARV